MPITSDEYAASDFQEIVSAPNIEDRSHELLADEIPHMFTWHVCLYVPDIKERSEGGIYLPQQSIDNQKHMTITGRIIAVGPLFYMDDKLRCEGDEDSIPTLGDWVFCGQYSGTRLTTPKGHQLRILPDTALMGRVSDPNKFNIFL